MHTDKITAYIIRRWVKYYFPLKSLNHFLYIYSWLNYTCSNFMRRDDSAILSTVIIWSKWKKKKQAHFSPLSCSSRYLVRGNIAGIDLQTGKYDGAKNEHDKMQSSPKGSFTWQPPRCRKNGRLQQPLCRGLLIFLTLYMNKSSRELYKWIGLEKFEERQRAY